MLVFEERGKPEFPEKNLSEQSREPTNSAHIWRRVRESNPGHIGGRRALSPLHHYTNYTNPTLLPPNDGIRNKEMKNNDNWRLHGTVVLFWYNSIFM